MKKLTIPMLAIVIAAFTSCAQETHEHHDKKETAKTNADTKTANVADEKSAVSIKEIVEHYLHLKDALVADNTNEAAKAGSELEAAFKKFDATALTAGQKKVY